MDIVFLGTPDFAAVVLAALLTSGHRILAAVTQPDKPRGRGNIVEASPVKKLAMENGIPVLQFAKIRTEGEAPLKELHPDIMVTCAYGQILTQNILDIAPKGIINVHASLLPKYRGAAPIQWAIINGETETGITVMQTELGVDTGDILYAEKIKINPAETGGELFERLAHLGGRTLLSALELIKSGNARPVRQDETQATKTKMLEKTDGLLNWELSAERLQCLVRGVNPWPGAYTYWNHMPLKVWESTVVAKRAGAPGEVVVSDARDGLIVCCGVNCLRLDVIQVAGSKRMTAEEYLRGKKIPVGERFENE